VRSSLGVAVNAIRPVVEDDIILQQRAGLALAVNAMVLIVGPSVVVGDGTVHLGVAYLRPDENPGRGRIMHDQIDELGPGRAVVDAKNVTHLRSVVHDLKSPIPGIRASDNEELRNRRALSRILAHHDRSGSATGETAPVAAEE